MSVIRKSKNISLSLIIQVYRGSRYFKECLESVKANIFLFNTIYISINKSDISDEDFKTALCFKEQIKQADINSKIEIVIFIQNQTLTAIEHGKVFYKKILQQDINSNFFMILCHDDILLPAFAETISPLLPDLDGSVILNPARSYYNQSFLAQNYIGSYYGLLSYPGLKTTKENFAAKGLDCYPETNITGLVFSKKVLQEFYRVLPFFSYGYRAEYIMMFVPSVHYIQGTSVAIVGIRRHAEQEGAQFIKDAYEADEQLYRFYMWYVTNNNTFKERIQKDISFFEKNPRKFLRILYLHFNCFRLTKSVQCLLYTVYKIPTMFFYRACKKLRKLIKSAIVKTE